MIIISTNRNVFPNKAGINVFGNSIGGLGNRYAIASLQEDVIDNPYPWDESDEIEGEDDWWHIELCKAGQEQKLFDGIVDKINAGDDKLKRPWVFFVHGNNQSLEKNLIKCKKIEDEHGVNVIAFSWPSMPRTIIQILFGMVVPGIDIKMVLNFIRGKDAISFGDITAKGYVAGKLKDYKEARKRARYSSNALMAALDTFHEKFFSKLDGSVKASLLVHSLGNHVMESIPLKELQEKVPKLFSNIIFHQADVQASRYKNWLPKLAGALADNTYVTVNEHDNILLISMLANRHRRLGQVSFGHDVEGIKYIDFTKGYGVDSSHNFFSMTKRKNEDVHALFDSLLKSNQFDLDDSASGFKKRKNSQMYELSGQYSEDIWGDNWEEDYDL